MSNVIQFIDACRSGNVKEVVSLIEKNLDQFSNSKSDIPIIQNSNVHFIHFDVSLNEGLHAGKLLFYYNQIKIKPTNNLILISEKNILENGFYIACQIGRLDLVNVMMQYVTLCFNDGLLFASLEGHLDIVKHMIALGANNIDWALYFACKRSHLSVAQCIMMENPHQEYFGALFELCKNSSETKERKELVELFLSKPKYNLNDLNDCLKQTCRHNNLMIAKLLVKHGANAYNESLYIACTMRVIRLVQFMLECDILANELNNSFEASMINYQRRGRQADIEIAMLILQKSSKNCFTCNDQQFLYELLKRGIPIEKFSCSKSVIDTKNKIQTFRSNVQNNAARTMPNDLLHMISEYSLF